MTKPKVLAYCILHYGADYLRYALESVYPCVDEILILYASNPSHGHGTSLSCPDSREVLMSEAMIGAGNKFKWLDGNYHHEGNHRDAAFKYARDNGYEMVVAVDSDEVWKTDALEELIQLTYERKSSKCLVWMRHLWRSFNYICDDPMRQERIYYIGEDRTDLIYAPHPVNQVWHFGYAREFNQVEYKISIHGHSNEWTISKDRWLNEKYKPFPPLQDVHPTCTDTWNPKPFDKNELPDLMRSHPWFNTEEIK